MPTFAQTFFHGIRNHQLRAQLAALSPDNKQKLAEMTGAGLEEGVRWSGEKLTYLATTAGGPPQMKAVMTAAGKALELGAPIIAELAGNFLHHKLNKMPEQMAPPPHTPPAA